LLSLDNNTARDITLKDINIAVYQNSKQLVAQPHRALLRTLLRRHSPFGGRDAEIKQLDSFADALSGYLFLTGASGFGKTALLANWIRSRDANEKETVYHFISTLDDTATEETVLRSLCQQVLDFHLIHDLLPLGTGALRSIYVDLLNRPISTGRKLVVVLDALDEASGWLVTSGLFPIPLPESVCQRSHSPRWCSSC